MQSLISDEILSLTNDGLDIFRHYLGDGVTTRKLFKNPYYDDSKPSCNIFRSRGGQYMFKDHGDDSWTGNCFHFVGRLKGLDPKRTGDFVEICKFIVSDLNLHSNSLRIKADEDRVKTEIKKVKESDFQPLHSDSTSHPRDYKIKYRDFKPSELAFWYQYGITKNTLERYSVHSVQMFRSISRIGKEYSLYGYDNSPIFSYHRDTFIKLYMPKNNIRFLYAGNKDYDYIFGESQLPSTGDTLIITGGEKDVLTLASAGYNAVSLNSETSNISDDKMQSLKSRFKSICVIYDMDNTGITSSKSLAEKYYPDIVRVELPLSGSKEEKDISDFFKINPSAKEELDKIITDSISAHNNMLQESQEYKRSWQQRM